MFLLKSNPTFRALLLSRIFNTAGGSLFSIAFLVYASTYPNAKIYLSIAALVATVPNFLTAYTGFLADKVKNKKTALFLASWVQTALFLVLSVLIEGRSMLIFVTCCLVLLVDSLLASFKNGLELPILQQRVADEDLQSAFGLFQGVVSIFSLIGQPIGVALLALVGHSFAILGLINAGFYFLSGLVLLEQRRALEITVVATSAEGFKFDLKTTLKNIAQVFSADGIQNSTPLILSVLTLNFCLNGVMSLIELVLVHDNPFGHNYGFAVMMFNVAMSAGMILGSFLMKDRLRKLSLIGLVKILLLFLMGMGLTLTHFGLAALVLLFALAYTFSKVNPKMSQTMLENIPAEVLGKISGGISTLFASASSVGVIVFVALGNLIGLSQTLYSITILSLITLAYLSFSGSKMIKLRKQH